jgi:hypothetical protein
VFLILCRHGADANCIGAARLEVLRRAMDLPPAASWLDD